MKKNLFLFCAILFFPGAVNACDICGCGAGNNYIGILPEFSKHILGLRYRYNSLFTHVGVGGATSYLTTREQYSVLEWWAGWNIGKKFRLMATIPYSFDEKRQQGIRLTKNGPGDVSVTGYYQLISSRKTVGSKLLVQSLWIGAGIKAPTGKYIATDRSDNAKTANLFQLGTGSTDFTLSALYDLRLQDAGINTLAAWKLNTTNSAGYNYGNKLNVTTQLYYKFRVKDRLTIAPNAGIQYENSGKDIDHAFIADISGGELVMGTIGLEMWYKNIAIGGSFQTPFSQNLANGIIKANNRAMLHISFLL